MTPVDHVLQRLKGVRKNGADCWIALCPVHGDRIASLSIGLGDDGRVLLHCHAGCAPEAIVAAIGLEMRDLFPDHNRTEPKETALYPYEDENGRPYMAVRRYVPKTFRQFRPDGNGGWLPGLNGIHPVLYRLPEIIKSEIVFIVEGEKDVETLRDWKIVATTNPGGAEGWREQFSEYLKGKSVVIIPDRDPPGEKHGNEVVHSLWEKAKAIKIIHLPKGKDITEWKEMGGTLDDLKTLVDTTPCLSEAPCIGRLPSAGRLTLVSLKELLTEPDECFEYLVENLLPTGGLSLLSAKPKTGKSTLARQLTLAVSRGEMFLGRKTEMGLSIYLALEERRADVRSHFRKMGATGDENLKIFAGISPVDGLELLRKTAEYEKPALIVVDTLARLVRVKDMNDYSQVTSALEPLLALAREVGSHVLLLHHAKKGDGKGIDTVLGSTGLAGSVDTIISLHRTDDYRTVSSIQRDGNDLPETVLQFDPETRISTLGGSREETEIERVEGEIIAFLRSREEPVPEKIIDEGVEGKTAYKRKALRKGVEDGRVGKDGKGGRGSPYLYFLNDSCSLVPKIYGEQGNNNSKTEPLNCNSSKNACSQTSVFSRISQEQESEDWNTRAPLDEDSIFDAQERDGIREYGGG